MKQRRDRKLLKPRRLTVKSVASAALTDDRGDLTGLCNYYEQANFSGWAGRVSVDFRSDQEEGAV